MKRRTKASTKGRQFLAFVTLFVFAAPRAEAHHLEYTLAIVEFDRNGDFQMNLQFHVAAFVLGEQPGLLSPAAMDRVRQLSDGQLQGMIDLARRRLLDELTVELDGVASPSMVVEFPLVEQIRTDALTSQPQPSPPVCLSGELGASTKTFSVIFPTRLGKVMLQLESNGAPPNVQILRPGERSWPYLVNDRQDDLAQRVPGWLVIGWSYLILGFSHILPHGPDHILFVLGLFLLSQRWGPLLTQVTAFTIAHSVTLALSMYGIFSLPAALVEPIIAMSIAYVAIENLWTTELKPWRPAVVFLFGLLHGLGFAGVLRELGVPSGDAVLALIGFNVGVEFGQLAVILLALLAVGWFRNRTWYRRAIVLPASCGIAFVGVYWTTLRVLDSTQLVHGY